MTTKKILCPVDFSSGSRCAMRTAIRLANERGAELELVHAWSLPTVGFAGGYSYAPDVVTLLSDDAQAGLTEAVAQATALGAKRVTPRLVSGVPWQQIVDLAADPAYELIVIGSHGRTGLGRVLIGSVAELVVRHAPCPVLTVRGDGEALPYRHVLCPVDFSPSSRAAVELASQLVQPGGAGVTLLYVLELPVAWGEVRPFDVYGDLDRRGRALLEGWVKELGARLAVPVGLQARVGSAGAQVLAAIDDDPTIDLVAMGSHGYTGLKRLALGSVAEKTVRHARCPVLVARGRGTTGQP